MLLSTFRIDRALRAALPGMIRIQLNLLSHTLAVVTMRAYGDEGSALCSAIGPALHVACLRRESNAFRIQHML